MVIFSNNYSLQYYFIVYSDFHKIWYGIMQCTKINLREMCSPTLLRLDGIGLALINGRSQRNIQYLVNIIISATLDYFSAREPKSCTHKLKSIILVTLQERFRHKQIGNVAMLWVIYHLGLPVLCNDNHFLLVKFNISDPVRVNIIIIKLRRYNVLTQESGCNMSKVNFRYRREQYLPHAIRIIQGDTQ